LFASADEDGLRVYVVAGRSIAPVAQIDAPVLQWLNESGVSDSWLRGEVAQRLQVSGPWSNIVAAALYARYLEPSFEVAKNWTDAALAGRVIDPIVAPRRWVGQLTGRQIQTVLELARAELDRIELLVDHATDQAIPEEAAWQGEWLEASHGRDDIEGIRTLLKGRVDNLPFADRLAQVDRAGRIARSVLPSGFVPSDERTRRASEVDPSAWWASK
jgi:hypothetical protein